jgi:hypothetical protein
MFDTLISTITVGAGGSTQIAFTGIPSTFSDLAIVLAARATSTTNTVTLQLNGSSANFSALTMFGNGAAQTSSSANGNLCAFASISTDTANTFGSAIIHITNYSAATQKVVAIESVTETNGATAYQLMESIVWNDTTAISSLSLNLANFAQYSSASLYGITKGTSGGVTVA